MIDDDVDEKLRQFQEKLIKKSTSCCFTQVINHVLQIAFE